MRTEDLRELLDAVREGRCGTEAALERLGSLPFEDIGCAKVDHHRQLRNGHPEVIYCEGKTVEQVLAIMEAMDKRGSSILGTRASSEQADAVRARWPQVRHNVLGRTLSLEASPRAPLPGYVAVVAAGTSDLPVVEEACETARVLGCRVEKLVDVGVAGIHRLFAQLDVLRGATVVIVVAGMEGALASVVGGLVDKPVIAVPTSVGYGASFGGVAALLAMLNTCASGVTVVNIDNGFGAAYSASLMLRTILHERT